MKQISFHGAAGTVTGSKYLLEVNGKKILIDCGMFQGAKELRNKNWEPLPFNPKEISAVILTHAHIDHSGFLPRLINKGYTGPVFATPPTHDILEVLLKDAAHIQEEDAAYRNRKGLTKHKPALALFTTNDVESVAKQCEPLSFGDWHKISDEFRFKFHIAGHILGAASIEIEMNDKGEKKTIFFSGDIGRYAIALVNDPNDPPAFDYLVCESTYGGVIHPPVDPFFELSQLLKRVIEEKRILLIPAFAIGRTQQLAYMVNILQRQGEIPKIDIHVDSPMAVRATNVYKKFPEYHSINHDFFEKGDENFFGKNITLHRKRKSSKSLNKLKGPAIILSASGMLTGGRIMHHLMQRLPDEKTILALVGFMAAGTLGRRIADGERQVRIHKSLIDIKAEVVNLSGLSGHADYLELLHWLEPVSKSPEMVFVTHGEFSRSEAMAEILTKEKGWSCTIPKLGQTIEL